MNVSELYHKLNKMLQDRGCTKLSPEEFVELVSTMEVKGQIEVKAGTNILPIADVMERRRRMEELMKMGDLEY